MTTGKWPQKLVMCVYDRCEVDLKLKVLCLNLQFDGIFLTNETGEMWG